LWDTYYVLVVIDVLSKFGWSRLLLDKTNHAVVDALWNIFDSSQRMPKYMYSDEGLEFNNKLMRNFLQKRNIVQIFAKNKETKAAVAERWIRTLKEKIFKYFTQYNTFKYYDVLEIIVQTYNNTVHSRTKFKPSEVNKKNEKQVYENLYGDVSKNKLSNAKFKQNDLVRVRLLKNIFEKGFTVNWSEKIYKISKILDTYPFKRYIVEDVNNQSVLPQSFYREQLQKVYQDNGIS
jgi:hypothetical protein